MPQANESVSVRTSAFASSMVQKFNQVSPERFHHLLWSKVSVRGPSSLRPIHAHHLSRVPSGTCNRKEHHPSRALVSPFGKNSNCTLPPMMDTSNSGLWMRRPFGYSANFSAMPVIRNSRDKAECFLSSLKRTSVSSSILRCVLSAMYSISWRRLVSMTSRCRPSSPCVCSAFSFVVVDSNDALSSRKDTSRFLILLTCTTISPSKRFLCPRTSLTSRCNLSTRSWYFCSTSFKTEAFLISSCSSNFRMKSMFCCSISAM
mmetsp:Transcript_101520/g.263051  ORF Transcript_101520/g.263051 Transcript_101520/m.263051 type:complete len:260 (+) Transcript_101520:366-1145(+)